MDFNTVANGVGVCLGLLLAYLALPRKAQAQFWQILLRAIQICLIAYAIYWIANFVMREGPPTRLEVFNFVLWVLNLLMTASSLVTQLAAAFRANKSS